MAENKELKKWLKKKRDYTDDIVGPRGITQAPFDPHIPEECMLTEYDEDTLEKLVKEQDAQIEAIEAMGGTKHLANRMLLIFDDLVGSTLFSGARRNPFKMLNTNHRHLSASILMVSQAYKEIPKTVRTQFSGLVMFAIANDAELKVIYEENTMGMKREVWDKVYHYCVDGDYDFMYLNTRAEKRLRVMKNFEQYVFMDGENE